MEIISALDAFRMKHRAVNWPSRSPVSRLGEICQPEHFPKFKLSREMSYFTIGSCFARNIEEHFSRMGIAVLSRTITFNESELATHSRPNDLLVKYTPASFLKELELSLLKDEDPSSYLLTADGKNYYDENLPMWFPAVSKNRAIARRGEIEACFRRIAESDCVILTLGLIEDWFDKKTQTYMNGTPPVRVVKSETDRFEIRRLSFDENLAIVRRSIEIIRGANPTAKVVLTVSPVPLARTFFEADVILSNCYSKSMLRAIAHTVASENDFVDYFPSYEIVTMTSQSMAWQDDLRHVQDALVGRIMSLFTKSYFMDDDNTSDALGAYADAASLLSEKKLHEAAKAFSDLEHLYDADDAFLHKFFIAAFWSGDHETALRVAERRYRIFPKAASSLQLAKVALAMGDFEKAAALTAGLLDHKKVGATAAKLHAQAKTSATAAGNSAPAGGLWRSAISFRCFRKRQPSGPRSP